MNIRMSIEHHLKPKAKVRPAGYLEDVFSRGTVDGDTLELTQEAYLELLNKYKWIDSRSLGGRAGDSVLKWMKAGMPVVSKETAADRERICSNCVLFDPTAFLGLGQCKHPSCGCSGIKRMMATEECPDNPPKWRSVDSK